jgi:hypothetical protein
MLWARIREPQLKKPVPTSSVLRDMPKTQLFRSLLDTFRLTSSSRFRSHVDPR